MPPDAPDRTTPPARGWIPVDLGGVMDAWPAMRGGVAGAFPSSGGRAPAIAAPEPTGAVVSLAARRESEAARASPRRIPEDDIVTIEQPTVPAPVRVAAVDEDALDLALVATPAEAAQPVPFPDEAKRAAFLRRRRILYLTGAAIIMATGAVHTFKSAMAARGVWVPDAASPAHRIT